ncbi:PEP-CTERM sorting domain-containing protein, partial [uncultured Sphingosinicella sp.]|uniref:PEP-CTERM sorting domain-containing protein n=1 Tax=uncultured Sphingosinicella sp. TaxID=478748 RepID=UPI0030D6FD36
SSESETDRIGNPFCQRGLNVGTNIFWGDTYFNGLDFTLDMDAYGFEVPIGHSVVSITYSYNFTQIGAESTGMSPGIYAGTIFGVPWISQTFVWLPSPSEDLSLFNDGLPLSAGIYTVDNSGFGCGNCYGTSAWDYSWVIEVIGPASDIPEPAALALFGLGVAGLAATRRRRRV